MTKIIILYTDAGGGHKSTALTLQEIITANTNWQVELVNPYKELCAQFDLVKRVFGISAEDLYNRYVSEKRSAFFKFLIISGFFKINLALPRNKIVRRLTAAWQQQKPSMIISVTPFINGIVADSIADLSKPVPFVTYITDYQECCKKIWITNKAQKIICCSEQLVQRAKNYGIPHENIFRLSGMLVAHKFYISRKFDRKILSTKLGLQANMPTAIVTFGSHGSDDMLAIAKKMCKCTNKMQMIFICGHDEALKQKLHNLKVNYPLIITGFIDNLEEYMQCADIFIGKPGGLSISEAALMKLPLIVKYNFFTLLQERHNAKWILRNKIGLTVKNLNHIHETIVNVWQDHATYAKNLKFLDNRAYSEILPLLQNILAENGSMLEKKFDLANVLA